MVGNKENYKFDVGVKGLIISLLGIIVSCFHMFCMHHDLKPFSVSIGYRDFFKKGFDQHNTMSIHV